MVMNKDEIVHALETGDMGQHAKRFNPAPSGRVEFGQVYVIPSMLRDEIIAALMEEFKPKRGRPKKEAGESFGKTPE